MAKTIQDPAITIRLPAPPVDVDLSNDGSRVAVALASAPGAPSVCIYDTATGAEVSSLAPEGNFGRGVVFGRGGRVLYGLVEAASGGKLELRRFALDGKSSEVVATYPYGEYYSLVRNQAADLIALLGHDVQVLRDDGNSARPETVRIIAGLDPERTVHAQLPAKGARVYSLGIEKDALVRWDLEGNRKDASWPAPDTYGRVAISRSGRHAIVTKAGGRGEFALDTETGERFMPDSFNETSINGYYAFAPDESGFAYVAGVRAGFRDWATQSRVRGAMLFDGNIAGLYGAWEADVYAYAYDESTLCIARMSG